MLNDAGSNAPGRTRVVAEQTFGMYCTSATMQIVHATAMHGIARLKIMDRFSWFSIVVVIVFIAFLTMAGAMETMP